MFRITSYGRTATKSIDLISKQKKSCTCSTHFCTFLCVALHDCNREIYRPCTTTTWKCLIASLMEDVNKRRWISFSLSKLECGPQEINSREIRLPLPFSANWNKRDKDRKNGNSFKSDVFAAVAVVDAKAPWCRFLRAAHVFVHFFAVTLHDYNAILYR